MLPPAQSPTAPVREVRAALAAMQPDVQRCSEQSRATLRRVHLRVWLEPNRRWTLEVPELARAADRSQTTMRACLQRAVGMRITRLVRPFAGRTRHKIEQVFAIRVPSPPPSQQELTRLFTSRRRAMLACVPRAGARGEPAELVLRGTLQMDGSLQLTGLLVPEDVPFDQAVLCVQRELVNVRTDPVTATVPFETALSFRRAPAPATPP